MKQIKSLWQTGSVVLIALGALMLTGGIYMRQDLLIAGGFVMLGVGLGLQGLHAVVYGEASVRLGRYRTQTRFGWGARLYGLQEGYLGVVLVLGGLWQAVVPGQPLKVAATPFGWSLICVVGAIFLVIASLVSLSGVTDWSESAWHRVPNRIFGVVGLLVAAGAGLFGVVTLVMPSVWAMLLGLAGRFG